MGNIENQRWRVIVENCLRPAMSIAAETPQCRSNCWMIGAEHRAYRRPCDQEAAPLLFRAAPLIACQLILTEQRLVMRQQRCGNLGFGHHPQMNLVIRQWQGFAPGSHLVRMRHGESAIPADRICAGSRATGGSSSAGTRRPCAG